MFGGRNTFAIHNVPEGENNRSHVVAGKLSIWRMAWQQGHAMAHISATIPTDTNLCQFLVLLYNVLKLFSAPDKSQEPILDFDRCQGNPPRRSHKPDWILSANHILPPSGPALMQYPALFPREDPPELDQKKLLISLLVLHWPRVMVGIELRKSNLFRNLFKKYKNLTS